MRIPQFSVRLMRAHGFSHALKRNFQKTCYRDGVGFGVELHGILMNAKGN